MSKLPKDFIYLSVEEKSEIIHKLTDEEFFESIPSWSFLFYKTNNIDGCLYDGWHYEKITLYKNKDFRLNKMLITNVESWYGFIEWDNTLGSQKIVNYLKTRIHLGHDEDRQTRHGACQQRNSYT